MQSQANLVLIDGGRVGGRVGSSAAYHLAQQGWTDVVVLDQETKYDRLQNCQLLLRQNVLQ